MEEYKPIRPTRPEVPIPALEPTQASFNQQVETGPRIALVMMVGNQMIGFFKMFLNCNILVPIPIEMSLLRH